MKREVKFSLVFRDMWQSAGKYVPRVDQLVKVAPAIIEMGCFARVETNGGGFEQVNLLFGENPNKAVREWTKPFHEAGIQDTHAGPRAERTPYEPRSGRRPQIILQSKESTKEQTLPVRFAD